MARQATTFVLLRWHVAGNPGDITVGDVLDNQATDGALRDRLTRFIEAGGLMIQRATTVAEAMERLS
jgi:hypothetical protein